MSRLTPTRESVTTIRKDGSRLFLHPADTHGRLTTARRLVALVLIGIYVLLPWIPVNGHPAVFLDVLQRRFHLFGATFAAQDLWLLFFLITGMAFGLFYLTSFLGRVWCGWACPQTVFLEHVFRRVERWIDGDAHTRRLMDAAPWTAYKAWRRVFKHALFYLLALLIAHLFLSYFVSIPQLWAWMRHSPTEHWGAFLFVLVASTLLYANFAWFREQLCIILCPYGRMQSALIDDHTINVAYDERRGEPRGHPSTPGAGHCIDCARCVQVCPTGIDIRQGLQLECIACTACIDACDEVMARLDRPPGLIRYDSPAGLKGERTRFLRPRTVVYTLLMILGASVALLALSRTNEFLASATRMPGPPFYVTADVVRNQFQVRLVNKRSQPATFHLTARADQPGLASAGTDGEITVEPLGEQVRTLIVTVPRDQFQGRFDLTVEVAESGVEKAWQGSIEFLGPDPRLLRPPASPQP